MSDKKDSNFIFSHFFNLENSKTEIDPFQEQLKSPVAAEKSNRPTNKVQVSINMQDQSDSDELSLLNEEICSQFKASIGEQKFNTYFKGMLSIQSIGNSELSFNISTPFIKKMLENHYLEQLNHSIENTLGKRFQIILRTGNVETVAAPSIPNSSFAHNERIESHDSYTVTRGASVQDTRFFINDIRPDTQDVINSPENFISNSQQEDIAGAMLTQFDPQKTFDNFIVGPSNNMAHAACSAVAESPGKVYPSLYIYSSSGLGKTHLLHAIANQINKISSSKRICLISANDFIKEMVKAFRERTIDNFRQRYTDQVDILMIDDIHEIKGKESTQNEFFNIFNELHGKGKQLIFTSDKMPKDIDGIEERVRTRLSWGLVVDIQQPDLETRIAILKHKAIAQDIYLPDDVINLMASSIKDNIRELEGSLIRLGAYSSLLNVDIDIETAREQLKLDDISNISSITMDNIAKTVATHFKIPLADIRSKSRQKEVTLARHIAMYLSYKLIKETLTEIGKYFGKRDHTSVLHAIHKIKRNLKNDAKISQAIVEIENDLN